MGMAIHIRSPKRAAEERERKFFNALLWDLMILMGLILMLPL